MEEPGLGFFLVSGGEVVWFSLNGEKSEPDCFPLVMGSMSTTSFCQPWAFLTTFVSSVGATTRHK